MKNTYSTPSEKRRAIITMVAFQHAIEVLEKEENYEACEMLFEAQQKFEAEITMAALLND